MNTPPLTELEEPRRYVTSRGYTVEFHSIPTLISKLSQQYPPPSAPTYKVPIPGGTETHTHDETTLETPDDHAAWAAYQTAMREHTQQLVQAQLRLCLLRGITVLNQDPAQTLDGWAEEQSLIGFKIPNTPAERKLHWLETEVLSDGNDFIAILAGVSRASGISEEVVSGLEQTFRRALGRSTRNAGSEPEPSGNGEGMVDGNAVRANGRRGAEQHPRVESVGHAG